MTKTKSDLILETLQEMGAVAAGETPSTEDVAVVDSRVQTLFDDLSRRNVIYIDDADSIDEAVFDHLVIMLSYRIGKKFGYQGDKEEYVKSENDLRTISRINGGTGAKLRVDCALTPRRSSGVF